MAKVKGGEVEPDRMCFIRHDDPIEALHCIEKFIYFHNKQ
jgi:hypothetical protein